MPKLKIDTETSLYDPIEIEIDGQVFQVKKINESIIRQLEKLDKKVRAGDPKAAYDRLRLLIGDNKCIGKLDPGEVREITNFITENAFSPKKTEKNLPGPGPEESQS